MYSRLKAELEEEIYTLEDELRRVVSERRARIQELGFIEEIFKTKLAFYEKQFETEKISESIYQDLKSSIEAEIEEVRNRISSQKQRLSPEGED